MKTPRAATPAINAAPIMCSEFRQGRSYTNWRPQGSGDWLIIVTLAGAGRVVLKGRAIRLGAGDAVLFAPGAEQDYSTDPEVGHWHLRWVHFQPKPQWRVWLLWPAVAARVGLLELRGPASESVIGALGRMLIAHRLGGATADDLAMNALEEALIWAFRFTAEHHLAGIDSRVQKAAHYLATHPGEPFRLDKVAAHCGLSPSRFSHLFREELGTTPQRFSEKMRLDHARQLLALTSLPIAEIAAEVGFADALYFSRRFKRAFGTPPMRER